MENCGLHKVRKHKDIKVSDKIVTLNISAKFDSQNKIKPHLQSQKENREDQERGW